MIGHSRVDETFSIWRFLHLLAANSQSHFWAHSVPIAYSVTESHKSFSTFKKCQIVKYSVIEEGNKIGFKYLSRIWNPQEKYMQEMKDISDIVELKVLNDRVDKVFNFNLD